MFKLVVLLIVGCVAAKPNIQPVPKLEGRIVGGVVTTIEKYPWQLSLLYNNQHNCGASIIGSYWALTAAHCTKGYQKDTLSLRSGSSYHATGGTIHKIEDIKDHDWFDPVSYDYDIALIKISNPFDLNVVSAIRLPSAGASPPVGIPGSVTGWGRIGENQDVSMQLRVVEVPVMSMVDCKKYYGENSITGRMFCAGYDVGGKDACQGDSGGPFVVNNVLHGITSWGKGCARPKNPGIYTFVGALRSWIADNSDI